MYAIACVAGVSIKLIGPMMKTKAEIQLPTPAWYPYSVNRTLNFWVSYVHQMLCGGAIISMHIGADTMLSGFMLQSCIQIKLLKYRLKNFLQVCKQYNRTSCTESNAFDIESVLLKTYIRDHQFTYK